MNINRAVIAFSRTKGSVFEGGIKHTMKQKMGTMVYTNTVKNLKYICELWFEITGSLIESTGLKKIKEEEK